MGLLLFFYYLYYYFIYFYCCCGWSQSQKGHPTLCKNLSESLNFIILWCLSAQPQHSWVNLSSARIKALITLIKEKRNHYSILFLLQNQQLSLLEKQSSVIFPCSSWSNNNNPSLESKGKHLQLKNHIAEPSLCISLHPKTEPGWGNIIYKVLFLELSLEESINLWSS